MYTTPKRNPQDASANSLSLGLCAPKLSLCQRNCSARALLLLPPLPPLGSRAGVLV